MIPDSVRRLATAPSAWLTVIFVVLQVIVMKIFIDLKEDDTGVFVSRDFGKSFIALLGRWMLLTSEGFMRM